MDPFADISIPDIDERINRKLKIPGGSGRKPPKYKTLAPDEEKSVLGDVLNKGIGGLQYLGETLDKPGRIIRGLATGNVRELGNLVPFSDTIGLTDPSKSTSGKDLLQHYGLQDKGAEGFGAGAAGFGAEVLTDPLTYLTLGGSALAGTTGKIAKAAGVSLKGANRLKTLGEGLAHLGPEATKVAEATAAKLGTTLAEHTGKQIGGAFGLTTGPLGILGISGTYVPKVAQGPAAKATLEGLGKIGETVGKLPGIKQTVATMRGAFGHEYQGHFQPAAQQAAKEGYQAAQKIKPPNLEKHLNLNDELSQLIVDVNAQYGQKISPNASAEEALKRAGEATRNAVQHLGETRGKLGAFEHISTPITNVAHDIESRANKIATGLRDAQDELTKKYVEQGHDLNLLQKTEGYGHFARRGAEHETLSGLKSRHPETRYVPAAFQEQMLHDPSLIYADTGKAVRVEPAILAKRLLETPHYSKMIDEAVAASRTQLPDIASKLTPKGRLLKEGVSGAQRSREKIARALAERIYGKGAELLESGKPLYSSDVIGNSKKFTESMGLKVANGDAVHGLLHANLTPAGPGTVPLKDVFRGAGMLHGRATKYMAKMFGKDPKALWRMHVPEDIAKAADSIVRKTGDPEWLGAFGHLADQFNKWFKTNVTLPFPGFAVRNEFSGQGMNFMSNEIPDIQHAYEYGKKFVKSTELLKDPKAVKSIMNELSAYGVFDAKDVRALDTPLGWGTDIAPNPISASGFLKNITGGAKRAQERGFDLGPGLLSETKLAKHPFMKRLIGIAATPAHIGAEFNKQIEFTNRVAPYLYFRETLGWSPEVAASKVRQLQVAYDELAPFEKQIMRRLVPFYGYTRKIMPAMFQQLAERPGGVTSQIVRASNTGRSESDFVPPYVGEGMSVKLGPDKYLSQLGLPTDQFSDLFVKGPTALGTVKRTGQKLLSMTNPLVKGPLETASGQNFFTGRPIEESFQYPTKSVLANQILHNTPASRAMTTVRQLADERKDLATKALNLGTGLRITDVSGGLDRTKRIAEAQMLSEMLKESPAITSSTDVYPRRDRTTGKPLALDPETEKLYRAYLTLKKQGQAEAKKRKKQPTALPVP